MRQGGAFWAVAVLVILIVVVVIGGGLYLATQQGVLDLSGGPDMEVTITASPQSVAPGGAVNYTVTYANKGESPAGSTSLTVSFPQEVAIGEAEPSGACAATGQVVACRLGTQNAGRSGTVTVAATVAATASSGAQLISTAEVTTSTTREVKKSDSVTDNNTASVTVAVQ